MAHFPIRTKNVRGNKHLAAIAAIFDDEILALPIPKSAKLRFGSWA